MEELPEAMVGRVWPKAGRGNPLRVTVHVATLLSRIQKCLWTGRGRWTMYRSRLQMLGGPLLRWDREGWMGIMGLFLPDFRALTL